METMPARLIRLRYPATCAGCGAELPAKTSAWWDADAKATRCEQCGSGEAASAATPAAEVTELEDVQRDAEPGKRIRVRYAGTCVDCAVALPAGAEAFWYRTVKTMRCVSCGEGNEPERRPEPEEVEPAADAPAVDAEAVPPAGPVSAAGGSAQREYERRKTKREDSIRWRHRHLGGLILALTDDPQSTTAWAKGAEGERRLGAGLDTLAAAGVVALHDRLIPGTRANIDHLTVTPTGVWVIDAKRYQGQVAKRDVGGWFSTDVHLYVGRRDCTKLATAMAKQVAAVRAALGDGWADVPIRPVLCFVDAEWGWFAKPFELNSVLVAWPKAVRELLAKPGPNTAERISLIAEQLESRLRPAT